MTYHWVDTNRAEPFTADASDHRELMAQIWYPADPAAGAARAPYIAEAEGRCPVLVFLSGLYGFRSVSTFQLEKLVSHGYAVVGLDQPGVVTTVRLPGPDPHRILAGHLDLGRVGVFGVSLGGRIAAESCLRDARIKACLVMDDPVPAGVVAAGLRQPTMFLTRDAETMRLERRSSGGWSEHDIATTLGTMRAAYAKLSGGGYYVEIPELFHVNFTDLPYWLPASARLGLTGPIGGRRGLTVINALLNQASRAIPGTTVAVRHRAQVPAE
ncbi:hypothetical protein ACQP2Y_23295 [Actinoplanes sp. CA-051413]|uniref:hypothetical protein n=1 Tax=Actinoplanes sp. CA-051413 TaxID=3239899 RepID=UPI003D980174